MRLSENYIQTLVANALNEDVGAGDITAALLPDKQVTATVIVREEAVLCGQAFVEAAFLQCDPKATLTWCKQDAAALQPNDTIVRITGSAKALVQAERTALNFLQTLSGTATTVRQYVKLLAGTKTKLLDTRKTIPGLRLAQKYAVVCGGGVNHRIGLFDAYLVKENHIAACGSITAAVRKARSLDSKKLLVVEVENFQELAEAVEANVDRVMLDDFTLEMMHEAVRLVAGKLPIEVSGNVNQQTLLAIAETGVDYISVGALTKHVQATDYSMRIVS